MAASAVAAEKEDDMKGALAVLVFLASCSLGPDEVRTGDQKSEGQAVRNPMVPGAPEATDGKMFREQLRTYLGKGGPDSVAAGPTKRRFVAALAHGKGVEGVTINPQKVTCGDQGCFTEVRYVDQAAVDRFDLRMLGGDSPFMQWEWGVGRTVPEATSGGLVATWYYNAPTRDP
jgi:hypothetical protein